MRFVINRLLGIRVDWLGLGLRIRGGRLDLTLERNVGGLGANDKRLLKEAEFLVVDPNGYQAVKQKRVRVLDRLLLWHWDRHQRFNFDFFSEGGPLDLAK